MRYKSYERTRKVMIFSFAPCYMHNMHMYSSGDGGGDAAPERMAGGHKRRIQPLGPGSEHWRRFHFHMHL